MRQMQSLADKLEAQMAPAIEVLGYELLCVELAGSGEQSILRVYIDAAAGIGVEDCAKVSRQVSALLDVEDPIAQAYRLEVSSPGFDRPLKKVSHYQQHRGAMAKIKLRVGVEGQRNFTGEIIACDAQTLRLRVDSDELSLALNDIERARLVPVYN